jgi:hypothetical protein
MIPDGADGRLAHVQIDGNGDGDFTGGGIERFIIRERRNALIVIVVTVAVAAVAVLILWGSNYVGDVVKLGLKIFVLLLQLRDAILKFLFRGHAASSSSRVRNLKSSAVRIRLQRLVLNFCGAIRVSENVVGKTRRLVFAAL